MKKEKRKRTKYTKRREFVRTLLFSLGSLMTPGLVAADEQRKKIKAWILGEDYKPDEHYWGMGIDINKCIGCGVCAALCPEGAISLLEGKRIVNVVPNRQG